MVTNEFLKCKTYANMYANGYEKKTMYAKWHVYLNPTLILKWEKSIEKQNQLCVIEAFTNNLKLKYAWKNEYEECMDHDKESSKV